MLSATSEESPNSDWWGESNVIICLRDLEVVDFQVSVAYHLHWELRWFLNFCSVIYAPDLSSEWFCSRWPDGTTWSVSSRPAERGVRFDPFGLLTWCCELRQPSWGSQLSAGGVFGTSDLEEEAGQVRVGSRYRTDIWSTCWNFELCFQSLVCVFQILSNQLKYGSQYQIPRPVFP